MADATYVEDFYARHRALYEHLVETRELSFAADFSATFARGLVLAIASYFEHDITEILTEVPQRRANQDAVVTSMIIRQVVSRKYHTYFDWERLKPGPFWALLGDEFKAQATQALKADEILEQAIQAFLELGQLRNKLVHQNYVQFTVEKTPEELIGQFRLALAFPAYLRQALFPQAAELAT